MRIMTTQSLSHRSTNELSAIFRLCSEQIATSEPGSQARRDAILTAQNVRNALAMKP